jgi:hypothetical protein
MSTDALVPCSCTKRGTPCTHEDGFAAAERLNSWFELREWLETYGAATTAIVDSLARVDGTDVSTCKAALRQLEELHRTHRDAFEDHNPQMFWLETVLRAAIEHDTGIVWSM